MTTQEHDAKIRSLLDQLKVELLKGLARKTNDQGDRECWMDAASQVSQIGETLTWVGRREPIES